MVKVNFAEARAKAEEAELLGGGTYFNKTLKNGDNRFRLVSECLEQPGVYNGKPTFKWLCLILDRVDKAVKPYFMPNTVYEQIDALQVNPDYAFDEVPMPFDLTLNVKGVGKKEVVYTVIPSPARAPLTADEQNAVRDAGDIREIQKAMNEKQGQVAPAAPEPVVGL